jgi:hypothetical protein
MFIVSLIEFSKHVQNEISAKVMQKPQNFTADFADRRDRRNYDPPKTPNYAERTTGPRSEVSVVRMLTNSIRSLPAAALPIIPCFRGSNKKGGLSSKRSA